jgi:membrane-associated phospholipid phosphatase
MDQGEALLVALTGFGDLAVLLPLAATIFAWLQLSRAPRAAAWWAIAVFLCVGATAALKIVFWGCAPVSDLHSPSGHASFSTLVYGATGLIVAAEGGRRWPQVATALSAALILGIALSRLLLGDHTVPEVVLGWVIGGACLAAFGRRYRRYRPHHARIAPLLIAVTILALLLHGSDLRAEGLLHRITGFLWIDCR